MRFDIRKVRVASRRIILSYIYTTRRYSTVEYILYLYTLVAHMEIKVDRQFHALDSRIEFYSSRYVASRRHTPVDRIIRIPYKSYRVDEYSLCVMCYVYTYEYACGVRIYDRV